MAGGGGGGGGVEWGTGGKKVRGVPSGRLP